MKACKIDITGRVQGVFFRAHACTKAKELSLTGTVKNMPDGSVQIIAQGDEEKLIQLVHWCHVGPLLAVVDEVRVEDMEMVNYTTFLTIK